ncbi:MAG: Mce-associated rane protein [Mycobacterium sp.]|jgi:Mce-associated membrane protein|nr:Mce-associated rane protein [Mycobacterium sp.]
MRWPTRRGGEETDADAVEEAPDMQTDTVAADETGFSEATAEVEIEVEVEESEDDNRPTRAGRRIGWRRAMAYAVLPAVALLLASAAGFLKYQNYSLGDPDPARESVRVATDGTVALLSYRPETVQKDLEAARSRLTGTFLDTYTKLTHDVVIPGAQQKQIGAVATVPAAASTSATATHAVVLLFVDQTVTIGKDAPTNTASSVRVTLDKVDNRWLISHFDAV